MLHEYTVNDDLYKGYAYKICGCHELKHDLVNDMYLKLYDHLTKYPDKKISNRVIYLIIRSIFIDSIRKNKEMVVDSFPEQVEEEDFVLCGRITMDEVLSEMRFFDREILLKAQEKSFRKISTDIDCHHSTVSKMYNNSLEKVKKICQEKGLNPTG